MEKELLLPINSLTEEERMLQEMARKFAQTQIKPKVQKMDEESEIAPEIVSELFQLGLMGIEIPEQYGGSGMNFTSNIIAIEEIATVDPSVAVVADVQNTLVNNAIIRYGTEQQKQKFLPLLASEKIGAYSLSESSSGSDAFGLATQAREESDHFVLNGQKLWVTNGGEADIFLVFATIDKSKGYRGITSFIVEKSMPGFSVGKREKKLGIRASSTCELILEDVCVPKENILGERGKGYKIAIETLNEGRIGIGGQMIGLARGALNHAIAYAKDRKQFGKSISEFQAIQFSLAQMATELEAARLMVYNAARLKDAKMPFIKEAAMAKYFSSIIAEKVASKSIEIFGGYGFTKEYPVEKYYRDAKVGQIYEGTTNMQLMTIAKILLEN